MKKETFLYLWGQGIVKAASDIVAELPDDLKEEYNVVLNVTDSEFDKLYNEYETFRKNVRQRYFDVGKDDKNLMDGHKVCSCITGALLNVRLVTFDEKTENMPMEIVYSNYAIAFLSGIYIQYLFLLSDYLELHDTDGFEILKEQATFYFPETNAGHDSYVTGRIKTLALNDMYGNDFDVLTYADMLFWIEKYNKHLISEKLQGNG